MTVLSHQNIVDPDDEDLEDLIDEDVDFGDSLDEPLDALKDCLEVWIMGYYKAKPRLIAEDTPEDKRLNDQLNNNEPLDDPIPPLPENSPPKAPPLPENGGIKRALSDTFDDYEPAVEEIPLPSSPLPNDEGISRSLSDFDEYDPVTEPTCSTPKEPIVSPEDPNGNEVSIEELPIEKVTEESTPISVIITSEAKPSETEKPISVIISGQTKPVVKSSSSKSVIEVTAEDENFNENDNDFDIIEILEENNIFTERRPNHIKPLINAEQDEMDDINDPRWDKVRNLKTDDERKRFAMESFGNREPANPAINLSYHGFLRTTLRTVNRYKETNIEEMADSRADLIRIKNGKVELLEGDNNPQDGSRPFQAKKRRASSDHQDAPMAKRPRMISISSFKRHLENVAVKYKEKRVRRKSDLRYFIRHWRKGMDESASFFKYYEENQDSNISEVDEKEIKKVEAMEEIYGLFTNYYGLTERTECKECSHQDKCHVMHSL